MKNLKAASFVCLWSIVILILTGCTSVAERRERFSNEKDTEALNIISSAKDFCNSDNPEAALTRVNQGVDKMFLGMSYRVPDVTAEKAMYYEDVTKIFKQSDGEVCQLLAPRFARLSIRYYQEVLQESHPWLNKSIIYRALIDMAQVAGYADTTIEMLRVYKDDAEGYEAYN